MKAPYLSQKVSSLALAALLNLMRSMLPMSSATCAGSVGGCAAKMSPGKRPGGTVASNLRRKTVGWVWEEGVGSGRRGWKREEREGCGGGLRRRVRWCDTLSRAPLRRVDTFPRSHPSPPLALAAQ
jgi:hypothetical protein